MPAEFEEHAATVLAWPHNCDDWPGKFQAVRWAFVDFIRLVSLSEPLVLLVPEDADVPRIRKMLEDVRADLGAITFLPCATDRGWMRDVSPAFVWDTDAKAMHAAHFGFNAWAKYPNWALDATIPGVLCKHLKIARKPVKVGARQVILEGGAIDGNGAGTLLTTEECLLDPEVQVRNPGWTREDYEAMFAEHLGIQQVIWLNEGIAGDDTHGHIDDLCRFVTPDTVVVCAEPNADDANYPALAENRERLQGILLANNKKLQVVELPMPNAVHFRGLRLPASYANFYITNQRVLVPTFNDPRDREALGILAERFPTRTVTGIHAVDLVWGFGTLHCLSHEISAPPTA